jgi:hypothetical protein
LGITHYLNDIANKGKNVNYLFENFAEVKKEYPAKAFRMQFTSNHDENSWNGTVYERLGTAQKHLQF